MNIARLTVVQGETSHSKTSQIQPQGFVLKGVRPMPPAQPALQLELTPNAESEIRAIDIAEIAPAGPRRLAEAPPIRAVPTVSAAQPRKEPGFQPRTPVITGEAHYRGFMPVDGIIFGQLGAVASTLTIRQRPKNGLSATEPELTGELRFKGMLRINGHVGGKVFSSKGTLIVDTSARVDAEIDVGVCVVSGTVNGDVVAHDRVELGPAAIIYGNIATRSITIKPGAIFHGECRMIKD